MCQDYGVNTSLEAYMYGAEFLPTKYNGSKEFEEAFIFTSMALEMLNTSLKENIYSEPYEVFVNKPQTKGWVDSNESSLATFPVGIRLGRLPLTKMIEKTGGNTSMVDFADVPKILTQLGLVQAIVSLDGLLVENGILRIKFK